MGTPYYLSPEICEERPYNELSDAARHHPGELVVSFATMGPFSETPKAEHGKGVQRCPWLWTLWTLKISTGDMDMNKPRAAEMHQK